MINKCVNCKHWQPVDENQTVGKCFGVLPSVHAGAVYVSPPVIKKANEEIKNEARKLMAELRPGLMDTISTPIEYEFPKVSAFPITEPEDRCPNFSLRGA